MESFLVNLFRLIHKIDFQFSSFFFKFSSFFALSSFINEDCDVRRDLSWVAHVTDDDDPFQVRWYTQHTRSYRKKESNSKKTLTASPLPHEFFMWKKP